MTGAPSGAEAREGAGSNHGTDAPLEGYSTRSPWNSIQPPG